MNNYLLSHVRDDFNFVEDLDWEQAAQDLNVEIVPGLSYGFRPDSVEYFARLINGKYLVISGTGEASIEDPSDYAGTHGEPVWP